MPALSVVPNPHLVQGFSPLAVGLVALGGLSAVVLFWGLFVGARFLWMRTNIRDSDLEVRH